MVLCVLDFPILASRGRYTPCPHAGQGRQPRDSPREAAVCDALAKCRAGGWAHRRKLSILTPWLTSRSPLATALVQRNPLSGRKDSQGLEEQTPSRPQEGRACPLETRSAKPRYHGSLPLLDPPGHSGWPHCGAKEGDPGPAHPHNKEIKGKSSSKPMAHMSCKQN